MITNYMFDMQLNYIFGIKMNEKECSTSVPMRNVTLHRQEWESKTCIPWFNTGVCSQYHWIS